MKSKFTFHSVLTAVFLFLSTSSFAATTQGQPNQCPSISSIQQSKFILAFKGDENWGVSQAYNKYDTNALWQVAVADVAGTGYFDALKQANAALPTLSTPKGPFSIVPGIWTCEYYIGVGALHIASATSMSLSSN